MRYKGPLIAVLLAFAAMRIIYVSTSPLGLSPDEAHYWEWSRRLDLSYYSKGPGVAYVIAFFTRILGNTVLGVRMGAVAFSTLASFMLYLFGKEVFGSEKTGFYSALLLNITPVFSVGSILMTTDVILAFFWITAVYCIKKALDGKGAGWWYLAGAFTGLGFLGKYTMALIFPCVFLFLLSSRERWHWFKKPGPYAAGLTSLAFSTPVILWNIMNGQVTIKHTMGQTHMGNGVFSVIPPLEFLASQAGLITPFIFAGLVYGVSKAAREGLRDRDTGLSLLFFTSAPLFVFFLIVSFHSKVQANWAIASYVTATPAAVWALGRLYGDSARSWKRVLKAAYFIGAFTGVLASIVLYYPLTVEAVGIKNILSGPPYNRVTGWKELGGKVSEIKEEMDKMGRTFIMSDTYQITSELAFYTRGNPVTYNIYTGARRMNQYDLWPGIEGLAGYNALYVKGGAAGAEGLVTDAFGRCDKEVFTVYHGEKPLKEFSIFRCYGFKGIKREDGVKSY